MKKIQKKVEIKESSSEIFAKLLKEVQETAKSEADPIDDPQWAHLPVWLREYASRMRCSNVDLLRKPLDFWYGAHNFLSNKFAKAYERGDGNLLKDPAVTEALSVLMEEPRELARKFFYRYTESPKLYGGDYDGDLKRITDDWRVHFGGDDPFTGYADWFNLMFELVGEPMALWILQPKALDTTSPIFASLKADISKGDFWEGAPTFPNPYGVERLRECVPVKEQKVFGAGFVTCTHPALRQLLQVARAESGFRLHGKGSAPTPDSDHRVGDYASKLVTDYDFTARTFKFKGVELDFSRSKERWADAQAVIESAETDGAARLDGKWRGKWQTATGVMRDFSRHIRPVRRKEGGWFHLEAVAKAEAPTRIRCKRFSQSRRKSK